MISLRKFFFVLLRLRDKRLQESEALENMGKIQDSWCKKSQAVSVVYEHIAGLIEVRKKSKTKKQAKPDLSCTFSLVTDLYREGYSVYCGSF